MSRSLTASDRKNLIRLASELPQGSPERRAILAGLSQTPLKLHAMGKTAAANYEDVVRTADRQLRALGFTPKTQYLSSGGTEESFASWVYKAGEHSDISYEMQTQDSKGRFWSYLVIRANRRLKEKLEASPKTLGGLIRAVQQAVRTSREWQPKLHAMGKTP